MAFDLWITLIIIAFFIVGFVLLNRQSAMRRANRQKELADKELEQRLMAERMDKTLSLGPRGYEAPPLEDTILPDPETDESQSYSEADEPRVKR